ncbi:hypothetical protein NEF87_003797 [Candidatus Lokiarchaeum ossiferum]|uniref:Phosphatidylglycerol lysyltransferase C-terminal domain-containing protein n=1 Tax=Candidatus Lokiarchaeum ossiferum TaxID=2951803 RepID=A0ABY6HYW6_9ARCH|nr:hypothetical protein NEF87_003797 [Candidatus Lokiarchaeum sp. B-35]
MSLKLLKPITLADKQLFQKFLQQSNYPISEYTFPNLYIWRNYYNFQWIVYNETLLLFQKTPNDGLIAFPPLASSMKVAYQTLMRYFNDNDLAPEIHRIPECALQILRELDLGGTIMEDRDNWDYIHEKIQLATLSGKKYQNIRKKLNKFEHRNNWKYEAISSENVEEIFDMQNEWCDFRSCSENASLNQENQGIIELLNNWNDFELMGGVIRIDGVIAAFTIGECLPKDWMVIHVEKGDVNFDGIYQAINYNFIKNIPNTILWVNREQDLGHESLREAKMRYHPDHFSKKYTYWK